MKETSAQPPVILITGASSGIGEAAARLFAGQGYRVALAARRKERLDALAAEIEAGGGQALAFPADLGRLDEVQALARAALDRFGQVDVLFNNAGFGRLDRLERLDPEQEVAAQLQVDLLGLIWMAQAVLPGMIARRSGHIINMASVAGLVGTPTYTIYAAAKFGVRGFTEALRREVAPHGIRVSGIYPGGTRTDFARIARAGKIPPYTTPSRLRMEPEDVARGVLSLVRRPRRSLVMPGVMRFAWAANLLAPGLVDALIVRFYTRRLG